MVPLRQDADSPVLRRPHTGTGVIPVKFKIEEPIAQAICNCGLTGNPPFCDSSHAEIE